MNQTPEDTLQDSIQRQRQSLMAMLKEPMQQLANDCARVWGERQALDGALAGTIAKLSYCKHLYVIDSGFVQISDNVAHGQLLGGFGRNRSDRPYLQGIGGDSTLVLSDAYISLKERRPSLTALQVVRNGEGSVLGYIGAYFGLRDLPLTRTLYVEPRHWRQIKGDPSIRGTVFHQNRSDSDMDRQLDTVLGVVAELMLYHGVFHVMLHFSSSRAVIWLFSDPYRYRLLDIDALVDPDTCLAYPRQPYPADALIPEDRLREVLDNFRALRLMDDMFYLRSGTVNVFNGIVGLTFSCDGSHYIPYEEFLAMDTDFWVGAGQGSS